MELLELEMRARAIKALLKKEEEGEEVEDDEWTDDVVVPLATRVENDVIQRPLKVTESATVVVVGDSNDKYKHRPSSTVHLPANNQQQLIQQTEFSRIHQDGRRRRPSSSSIAARHETLHKHPRHYRHHHCRQDRSRSPTSRRRETDAESSTKFNKSSTPPASPLPMASTRHTAESTDTGSQVGRIESEPDMKRIEKKDDRSTQVVVEEEEQQEEEVEYEEEGIQEVDIELGSGSDDEAHFSRF
jgi:hypothetical protein